MMLPVLLPFYGAGRHGWQAALAADPSVTVVCADEDRAVVGQLRGAGVAVLGRVDAEFGDRPLPDLLDEVEHWAGAGVTGIFLDRAPTSVFCLGPVALAGRVARRCGMARMVLNPGVPTDPRYRELGAAICSFEGPWLEYRRWSGEGSQPGDGHLVHSVPVGQTSAAWQLLRERGAGWGLVTDGAPPALR